MLEPQEALSLLTLWAGDDEPSRAQDAAELAERLGRLPLALKLAGAQAQDGVTWGDLLARFRDAQGNGLSQLDMDDPSRRDESLRLSVRP